MKHREREWYVHASPAKGKTRKRQTDGPFATAAEAVEFAEKEHPASDWGSLSIHGTIKPRETPYPPRGAEYARRIGRRGLEARYKGLGPADVEIPMPCEHSAPTVTPDAACGWWWRCECGYASWSKDLPAEWERYTRGEA